MPIRNILNLSLCSLREQRGLATQLSIQHREDEGKARAKRPAKALIKKGGGGRMIYSNYIFGRVGESPRNLGC